MGSEALTETEKIANAPAGIGPGIPANAADAPPSATETNNTPLSLPLPFPFCSTFRIKVNGTYTWFPPLQFVLTYPLWSVHVHGLPTESSFELSNSKATFEADVQTVQHSVNWAVLSDAWSRDHCLRRFQYKTSAKRFARANMRRTSFSQNQSVYLRKMRRGAKHKNEDTSNYTTCLMVVVSAS